MIEARVIIDATGQQSLLANRLRLKKNDLKLRKAAIWGHFAGGLRHAYREGSVTTILHTEGKRAWFWYIPIAGDRVSVGLVGDSDYLLRDRADPEEVFCEHATACPAIRRRLVEATLSGRLRVAKEFSYTSRQRAGDGWVSVGDASGFIDPIYSTGVFLALKSGELAADCVTEGLRRGDLSVAQLGKWTAEFEERCFEIPKAGGGVLYGFLQLRRLCRKASASSPKSDRPADWPGVHARGSQLDRRLGPSAASG